MGRCLLSSLGGRPRNKHTGPSVCGETHEAGRDHYQPTHFIESRRGRNFPEVTHMKMTLGAEQETHIKTDHSWTRPCTAQEGCQPCSHLPVTRHEILTQEIHPLEPKTLDLGGNRIMDY